MTALDVMNRSFEAVQYGEWETLAGLLSGDFFDYSPRQDEPTAAARVVQILSDLKAAMPDLSLSVDDADVDGEAVSAVLSLTGTHMNPLWGSPGTGNPISWVNPITAKLIDGRLSFRFDDVTFPELISFLRQLGLVNPPDEMDRPLTNPVSVPEFLLKVVMTGQAGDKDCTHLDQIQVTEPTTRMCAACYAEGVNWPALRMCLTCGFVGCCDTSRNKHARGHHDETGHPMMRSIRMDEGWAWCYVDNAFFEKTSLARYRA